MEIINWSLEYGKGNGQKWKCTNFLTVHNREPTEILLGIKHTTAFKFIKVLFEQKNKISKLSEETHKTHIM